jgi:predicted nucleic acid-binding protein
MRCIHVDATTLIALGRLGEMDLLANFDGTIVVQDAVRVEVTAEPARTNVDRLCERDAVLSGDDAGPPPEYVDRACAVLGDDEPTGDAYVVGAVLAGVDEGEPVGVVSDDRRVRTVAEGLGATVTGTVGVVVRAVEEGLDAESGRSLLGRIDDQGLHMTGELRETAERLVEEAATDEE